MNKILIIFLIIGFYSCEELQKSEKPVSKLNGFELLQNFEKHKAEFETDTYELKNHSSDGGELTVFHDKNFEYIVYDFWLFGETGKLNYTYWTEKNGKMTFKLVKQLKYIYDKPYYEEDYKTDSIMRYLSYSDSKTKLFDLNKKEIIDSELLEKTKSELELFLRNLTKGIEIIK